MDNSAKRRGYLTSEHFAMILCGPNFVVSRHKKLNFTSKLPLPLESSPIKFETQMLSNSDNIYVRNHHQKFLKLSQTSFSGIIDGTM